MSEDTSMEEIISQMNDGEGFFVHNGVRVLHRKGRPFPTDCNGNQYKTYALFGADSYGDELTDSYLSRQFCQMILGKVLSISCMKPEGEVITLKPVSIIWRMTPEIEESDNEKVIMSRCAFYVHDHPFDNGMWVD